MTESLRASGARRDCVEITMDSSVVSMQNGKSSFLGDSKNHSQLPSGNSEAVAASFVTTMSNADSTSSGPNWSTNGAAQSRVGAIPSFLDEYTDNLDTDSKLQRVYEDIRATNRATEELVNNVTGDLQKSSQVHYVFYPLITVVLLAQFGILSSRSSKQPAPLEKDSTLPELDFRSSKETTDSVVAIVAGKSYLICENTGSNRMDCQRISGDGTVVQADEAYLSNLFGPRSADGAARIAGFDFYYFGVFVMLVWFIVFKRNSKQTKKKTRIHFRRFDSSLAWE